MTLQSEIIWKKIHASAKNMLVQEPALESLVYQVVLANDTMGQGLGQLLAHHQFDTLMGYDELSVLFQSVYAKSPEIVERAAADLEAVIDGDPAATDHLVPYLYFKGFHALQTYRVAHVLWQDGREHMALFLQNRSSLLYGVDIHPAAQIGKGIMFDHATGIVIGETSVVEDGVAIFHGATLGGTGTQRGDRHPKIRRGVMVGSGATILGNIEIGENTTVAAGSMVLKDMPANATVVGIPARVVTS